MVRGLEEVNIMFGYKDWKDDIYVIAAIIYVVGMLPLYYFYQANPVGNFHLVDNIPTFQ